MSNVNKMSRSDYWKAYKQLVQPSDRQFKWAGKGHAPLIRDFVDSRLANVDSSGVDRDSIPVTTPVQRRVKKSGNALTKVTKSKSKSRSKKVSFDKAKSLIHQLVIDGLGTWKEGFTKADFRKLVKKREWKAFKKGLKKEGKSVKEYLEEMINLEIRREPNSMEFDKERLDLLRDSEVIDEYNKLSQMFLDGKIGEEVLDAFHEYMLAFDEYLENDRKIILKFDKPETIEKAKPEPKPIEWVKRGEPVDEKSHEQVNPLPAIAEKMGFELDSGSDDEFVKRLKAGEEPKDIEVIKTENPFDYLKATLELDKSTGKENEEKILKVLNDWEKHSIKEIQAITGIESSYIHAILNDLISKKEIQMIFGLYMKRKRLVNRKEFGVKRRPKNGKPIPQSVSLISPEEWEGDDDKYDAELEYTGLVIKDEIDEKKMDRMQYELPDEREMLQIAKGEIKELVFKPRRELTEEELTEMMTDMKNALVDVRNTWNKERLFKLKVTYENPDGITEEKYWFIGRHTIDNLKRKVEQMISEPTTKTSKYDSSREVITSFAKMNRLEIEAIDAKNTRKSGGFFKYYHMYKDLDLSKLQIYNLDQLKEKRSEFKCLVHAILTQLKDKEEVEEKEYKRLERDLMETTLKNTNVQILRRDIGKVCNLIGVRIKLKERYKDRTQTTKYGSIGSEIEIGLIDEHFFRNDKCIDVTSYSIKHYDEVKDMQNWKRIKGKRTDGRYIRDLNRAKPFAIIEQMLESKKHLKPITGSLNDNLNLKQLEECDPSTTLTIQKDDNDLNLRNTLAVNKNIYYSHQTNVHQTITGKNWKASVLDREYRMGEEIGIEDIGEVTNEIIDTSVFKILNNEKAWNKMMNEVKKQKRMEGIEINEEELENDYRMKYKKIKKTFGKRGISKVVYNASKGKLYCGRDLASGANSIQNLPRAFRYLFTGRYYRDIDMVNCHPVLLGQLMEKEYNIRCPNIKRWANERREIIKEIQSTVEVSRSEVKRVGLSIMNGGNKELENLINKIGKPIEYLTNLKKECDWMREEVIRRERKEFNQFLKIWKTKYEMNKHKNPKASYISHKLTHLECKLLNIAIRTFKDQGLIKYSGYVKIHDGFQYISFENDVEKIENTIHKTEQNILKETGYMIQFKEKNISEQVTFTIDDIITKPSHKEHLMKYKPLEEFEPILKKMTYSGMFKRYNVCFMDFETTTENEHKAFMVSYKLNNEKIRTIIGRDCARTLLERLPSKTHIIAHNMDYDYRFILHLLDPTDKITIFNGVFMAGNFTYKSKDGNVKRFHLKDSYKLIPAALSKFGKMFQLEKMDKEVLPYTMYNDKSIGESCADIEIAKEILTKQHPTNYKVKIKHLIENIDKHNWWVDPTKRKYYKHMEYVQYYCEKDVKILSEGYNAFRDQVMKISKENYTAMKTKPVVKLDIDRIISVSSIAEKIEIQNGCLEGIVKMKGQVMRFIQKSVKGGRVATYQNKRLHVSGNTIKSGEIVEGKLEEEVIKEYKEAITLADPDANSLYPTAMFKMKGYYKGHPVNIEQERLTGSTEEVYKWLETQTGYFVEIEVLKVNKHRPNAIYPMRIEGKNVYDDSLWVGGKFIVSDVALNDLMKFHKIEYKILRGVYFNSGVNSNIKKLIDKIYNLRLKYKKEGNPLQQTLKLMMNSIFGKKIMKEQKTKTRLFKGWDKTLKFAIKEHMNLQEVTALTTNKNHEQDPNTIYRVEMYNSISQHTNYAHIGSVILDMSKRIMNEVMQLADDEGIMVVYTDTDSMHLPAHELETLAEKYKIKYGGDLLGKGLGQFSSDFEVNKPKEEIDMEPVATDSYFMGKKVYYDEIQYNTNGATIESTRMKGVSDGAIEYYTQVNDCKRKDVYERLYQGEEIEFDLTKAGTVRFIKRKDMSIVTKTNFKRRIKL